MKKSLLLAACLSSVSGAVIADENPDLEVYLGAARYFWDSDRSLDDANSLEAGAELPVTENLSFEAWINDFETDNEAGSAEFDGNRYSLGALYHLMDGDYRPFITLGGSHQAFEIGSSDAHESLAYLGVGAKKYLDNQLVLRGDLFAMNSIDYEVTDIGLRIALGYAFGAAPKSSSPEPAPKPMVKKEEPKPVVAKPMPAEPVVEKKPVAPKPVPVPVVPPKDTDGDGVIDSKDKCPETDKAFKVDASGCPVKLLTSVTIDLKVQFKTNSAEVAPESEAEIKEMADFLKKFADTSVTVEGHTDDRGSAAYNKSLSQKRADSVKQKLVNDYGIAASRVTAIGYGEERPIATNDTAEGRATNRRVVGVVKASVETMQKR